MKWELKFHKRITIESVANIDISKKANIPDTVPFWDKILPIFVVLVLLIKKWQYEVLVLFLLEPELTKLGYEFWKISGKGCKNTNLNSKRSKIAQFIVHIRWNMIYPHSANLWTQRTIFCLQTFHLMIKNDCCNFLKHQTLIPNHL